MNQGAPAPDRVINQIALLGFMWFFVEWIACCVLIVVCFRRITQKEVRQGLIGMAMVMVAWVPFWIYEVMNHRPIMSPYYFALLWSALSLILAIRHFFQPQAAAAALVALPAAPGPLADGAMLDRFAETRKLTPRERELSTLLVEGLNHAAIAQRLFISEKTVRNHVSNIYAKVGVSSLMELIRAIRGA
jgi:DNA-binding CsgD family transcriptional regulator